MHSMAKLLVLIMSLLWVGSAQAIDPVVKCQEAKLKAQGKLQQCLKNNSAKVLGGGTDASAACQAKFSRALLLAGANTACRYIDNGDGTVSDLDTGLQWEKKTNLDGVVGSNVHDADVVCMMFDCDYSFLPNLNGFSPGGTPPTLTGCFAGHCDWRLPTVDELIGIIDPTQGFCVGGSGACIDPIFGPTQGGTIYAYLPYYVSASQGPGGLPWVVDFTYGGRQGQTFWTAYVRAVRGGL